MCIGKDVGFLGPLRLMLLYLIQQSGANCFEEFFPSEPLPAHGKLSFAFV